MHGLQIAADGIGAERHRAVHPGADPGRTSALEVAAETRRNFDSGPDASALQALPQIGIIGELRLLHEISRASQLLEVGAALVTLVVIEHCKGEIVDVRRNSEAEDQHQQRRAEQGEGQPDGIAQKLDRFPDRVSEETLQAERALRLRRQPRRFANLAVDGTP